MMDETLTPLIVATIAFVGSHFLLSAMPVRTPIIGAIGRWGFIALYSVVSLATFVWMNIAFTRAPLIDLWPGMGWMRWVALVVILFASILLVCGVLTPNPTATMIGARVLARDDAAAGIFTVTRHPIMWAVTLWAAAHMMTTGDAGALIFFGGLGVLAFFGMMHMDARRDAEGDPRWLHFRARTSMVPFVAILGGQARVTLGEIGWVRMALGIGFWAILAHGHEYVIGVVVAPWV